MFYQHKKDKSREYYFVLGLVKWINSNFKYRFKKELDKMQKIKTAGIDLEIVRYEAIIEMLHRS